MAMPGWYYLDFIVPILLGLIVVAYVVAFIRSRDRSLILPLAGFALVFLQSSIMSMVLYSGMRLPVYTVNSLVMMKLIMSIIGFGLITVYMFMRLQKTYTVKKKETHKKSHGKTHKTKKKASHKSPKKK